MRLYELLLHLYPASFRAEYGAELRRVCERRRADAPPGPARLALWLSEAADLLASALQAHADVLGQDLRYAFRSLARTPGFAATAVLVSALGIGANTAVFSVTDRVLIRPLPFPDSERLVKLWQRVPEYSRMEPSPANYRDWRRMSTSFEAMGAYQGRSLNLVGRGEPRRLDVASVTRELLPLLGTEPALGRLFGPDDDEAGAPATLLLSHGAWQSEFGGRADVLGTRVRLDGESHEVIGVLPRAFGFPSRDTQLWTPMRFPADAFEDRTNNYLRVVARLKPGVTLEQARAEMQVIGERLEREYPKENLHSGVTLVGLRDEMGEQSRLLLTALFGASLCVLLLACANLASLLLARALLRRRELGVRAALGAGRERLVRQLLTESLVIACCGGSLGVLLAVAGTPLLGRFVPSAVPIASVAVADPRVLAFAAALSVLTGLGFGVLPALRTCSGAQASDLREGARSQLGGGREPLRFALVVAEVAAAVVLVVSSGLLIRALWRVESVDPGFRAEGVLTLRTPLPSGRYDETQRRAQLYERILSEVRALPGVSRAAYISFLPMTMRGGIWPVTVAGLAEDPERPRAASLRFVTPGFFEALGVPLRRGRDVALTDTEQSPQVAVVSESFARWHWPGQDPLGRRFQMAFRERTVVGVVGDIRVRGLERPSEPQVYLPHRQVPDGGLLFYAPKDLAIRASVEPGSLADAVRRIVRKADPELPISDMRPLGELLDAETAPRRAQLYLLGAFALVSLLLAGLGIHGLLSYAVSQRIPEIGLRVALGAEPGRILRLVLGDGLTMVAWGTLAGTVGAYWAGRALQALLAGVRPGDPATLAAAVCLALLTALSGCLVPALRALRVDPATALRTDT